MMLTSLVKSLSCSTMSSCNLAGESKQNVAIEISAPNSKKKGDNKIQIDSKILYVIDEKKLESILLAWNDQK